MELFEDLDEGPVAPEPDAACFSQHLVCSAAEPPPGPSETLAETLSAHGPSPPAEPAGGGGAAVTPQARRDAGRAGPGSGSGLGSVPGAAEEPARPDGASDTDGWDEDMSPFELLPGMPGCQAAPEATPYPNPNPTPGTTTGPPAGRGPAAAGASPQSPAPAYPTLTLAQSGEGWSGGAGDGRHVVICSAEGVGCSGELRLALAWASAAQLHPTIRAELTLEPLQVR